MCCAGEPRRREDDAAGAPGILVSRATDPDVRASSAVQVLGRPAIERYPEVFFLFSLTHSLSVCICVSLTISCVGGRERNAAVCYIGAALSPFQRLYGPDYACVTTPRLLVFVVDVVVLGKPDPLSLWHLVLS